MKVRIVSILTVLALLIMSLVPLSAQHETECENGFRIIEHAAGVDCIPENPQRIIVLDEGTMADLLAPGLTPIGVMDWGGSDSTPYLTIEDGTIASVGTPDGPDYETMLSLEPDLIIGRADNIEWFGDNAFDFLQEIGVTVLIPHNSLAWKDHFLFLGEVVNQQNDAQAIVDDFDARLQEFREAWSAQNDDSTIAIIRSRADAFNIYASQTFISNLVEETGLTMPASFATLERRISISVEEIDMLASDYLFVMARNDDEAEAFVDASNSPLWQFLPTVENEQVIQVDWRVWVAGWNIIGANLVIDDLFFYLTNEEATTPNPVQDIVDPDYETVLAEKTDNTSN